MIGKFRYGWQCGKGRRMLLMTVAIQVGMWDTAGSERFQSMMRIYYRGAGTLMDGV